MTKGVSLCAAPVLLAMYHRMHRRAEFSDTVC